VRSLRWWVWGGLAALIAAIAVVVFLPKSAPPPPPGIPLALAEERARRVSALEYDLSLAIPGNRAKPIDGRVVATFQLADTDGPLAFDFAQPADRVRGVRANNADVQAEIANGHVVIPRRALVKGANTVEIAFMAGDEALNRQDEFLYSLFVPARASLAMPVFDQPDLKAKWRLSLTLPPDWIAVSNAPQTGRAAASGTSGVIFDQTTPISTYLFAFAAGKFQVETADRQGRTFRMFHRETDAAKVARNRDAIFDLHARALEWLEAYTDIPYPFGKFDFVLIPSFQFGGMEHPGAVFYNANGLLLDPTATENEQLGRASLISHETSHMWFGDLVTMRWFNDVWMKEVFANFMAAKIVNPSFPKVNHELRFFLQHYPAAYGVDRTAGANPIRQELANLNEAGSLYGAIIYQKAPIVMRHLETLMGADTFRAGLREYLAGHQFGNATWTDLVAVLDKRTDVDLVAWSRAWVEERGRPRIDVTVADGNGTPQIALTASDPLGRNLVWPQTLSMAQGVAGRVVSADAPFSGTSTSVPIGSAGAPRWLLPTGGGLGYGDFVLDRANLDAIAAALPSIPDELTRGAALVTLWESMLEGRFPPAEMMKVLTTALPRETVELNLSQLLGYTRTAFWRFTAADDRPELAPRLEALLRAGLDRAATTSAKSAWFGTLRSVATTAPTIDWLTRVWRRDVKIPGLTLAETDETDLAFDLALRGVDGAERLLDAQLERITNPDRRARFAFVRPAVSSETATRDRFFESLKDVANRRRESWVLDGIGYLHHPLRAGTSRKHVRAALDLVREIQRTGDIFFPKRWADATLGGYQSVQTAAEVRAFIDALPPDYPQRLRWVLLSSADQLFRASKLLSQ
jgi:aminopeptidase N